MDAPGSCLIPKRSSSGHATAGHWQDAVRACCMIDLYTTGEHGSTHGQDAGRVSVQRRQQVIGSVSRQASAGEDSSPAAPCRCAPARRMRVMPPVTAAASLGDPAESGHTRGSEVARCSRRPLPLACHSQLDASQHVLPRLSTACAEPGTGIRQPCIMPAAQSSRRVRAATMRATCPSQRCSRDGPAACHIRWTRCILRTCTHLLLEAH